MMEGYDLRLFVEETSLYNRVVLGTLLPGGVWDLLPHFLQTWLRKYIAGCLLYLVSGSLWCFYIYHLYRNVFLPEDSIPSSKSMLSQISLAMKGLPWYTLLPTVSEYMIENGWTRCYPRISDVGWVTYILCLAIYLVIVEFGIYWMHRGLHEIKTLYKYLHSTHHIYNKENSLSPFAEHYAAWLRTTNVALSCRIGMAKNPLDGVLEALPHVIPIFLLPTHFKTHLILIFMEAIWAANLHDCINVKLWPVMGAGYHTIHHITYRHNYGNYTIWMDWMFGTLQPPADDEKKEI